MEINTVGIVGTVETAPQPYRSIYGYTDVYAMYLDVTRDSGIVDRILVLFQENKIEGESFQALPGDYFDAGNPAALIKTGSKVEVTGKLQTHKNTETGRTQLFIWGLFIQAVPDTTPQLNTVYIKSEIAKQPIYRETLLGKRIAEVKLCVQSEFTASFYSYIPCLYWERLAKKAAHLTKGTVIYLEGRLQSREYTKTTAAGEQVITTWEVSGSKLEVQHLENE